MTTLRLPTTRENRLIALLLGVVATLVLHFASRTEGFTRDEGYYFDAAEMHWAWYAELGEGLTHGSLDALSRNSVDRWFGYNHEHPPLMKSLYGISWRLFHRCNCPSQGGRHSVSYRTRHATLGLMSEAEAFRFPAHAFGGLMVAFAFLFGAHAFSRRAGLVAAVLSLAAPRMFFHAELSAFDAPMATTWLLTIYCYLRSLEDRRYAVWTGLSFGLAIATKHNGYFIPIICLIHYLWIYRHRLLSLRLPPILPAFVYMAVLGPLVLFVLWPWMWFDTISLFIHNNSGYHFRLAGRFPEYLEFHLKHVYYNFEYLGTNYNKPPFPRSFPFVMTLLTAPVTTLTLAALGTASLLRSHFSGPRQPIPPARDPSKPPRPPVHIWEPAPVGIVDRGGPSTGHRTAQMRPADRLFLAPCLLVFLNALWPPAIITITGAPIFGATKHWLPAIPFIAILAGIGADRIATALAETRHWQGRKRGISFVLVFILACAPAISETWRSHPNGLSFYNVLAGGPAGGADLGMNRQFWGYSTRGVLPWINQHVPKNGNVYWHDANQVMLNMDVRENLLRTDVQNTGLEEPGVKSSGTAMVIHEKHFNKYEYWIWDFYGTARPSFVYTDEGVPLVTVYERPQDLPSDHK